jgi:hypothetical protein
MSLESKELLHDDFKLRSDGLLNALRQDKLGEARSYIPDIRNSLDSISNYLDAQKVYAMEVAEATHLDEPKDVARSEAEIAVQAAKRAKKRLSVYPEQLRRLPKNQEGSRRLQSTRKKRQRTPGRPRTKLRRRNAKHRKSQ